MTEIYKKNEDQNYVSQFQQYIDILPKNAGDYASVLTDQELPLLDGTDLMKENS